MLRTCAFKFVCILIIITSILTFNVNVDFGSCRKVGKGKRLLEKAADSRHSMALLSSATRDIRDGRQRSIMTLANTGRFVSSGDGGTTNNS